MSKKYGNNRIIVGDKLTFIEFAPFFKEFTVKFRKNDKETLDSLTTLDNKIKFVPEKSKSLSRFRHKAYNIPDRIVYFSKPYRNYLIAEVINYRSYEKSFDADKQRSFNGGEQFLFEFDDNGKLLSSKVIPVSYN